MAFYKNPYYNLIGIFFNFALIVLGIVTIIMLSCPKSLFIPIYLIVAGVLNLLTPPGGDDDDELLTVLIRLLKVPLIIAGLVLIAQASAPDHIYRPLPDDYDDGGYDYPEETKLLWYNINYCYKPVYTIAYLLNIVQMAFLCLNTVILLLFSTYRPWKMDTPPPKNEKPESTRQIETVAEELRTSIEPEPNQEDEGEIPSTQV